MSLIAIAMNILLAVLLVAVLWLGWRLDRRLRAIRDGQGDFTKAIAQLDSAAARAHAGLAELRAATDEAIDLLGGRIARAREASDRLDQALARAEAMPMTAPIAQADRSPLPAREGVAEDERTPRGFEALLARIEASQARVARPAEPALRPAIIVPEAPPPAARRPMTADDDLFVDGALA